MRILEIFIALSLFNMLLYFYLKSRKENQEYYQWLKAQEDEEEIEDQENQE